MVDARVSRSRDGRVVISVTLTFEEYELLETLRRRLRMRGRATVLRYALRRLAEEVGEI